eukprot:scaffold296823_cov15-Tisochrysis_lutea.AAC.1
MMYGSAMPASLRALCSTARLSFICIFTNRSPVPGDGNEVWFLVENWNGWDCLCTLGCSRVHMMLMRLDMHTLTED